MDVVHDMGGRTASARSSASRIAASFTESEMLSSVAILSSPRAIRSVADA